MVHQEGKRFLGCCMLLCLLTCGTALRAQFTWINPLGGQFADSTNWLPSGPPANPTDIATFGINSSYNVLINDFSSHGGLNVSSGTVQFRSDSAAAYAVASLNIAGGAARIEGSLALFTTDQASINGRFVVSGPNASYNALEPLSFWGSGTGSATVQFANAARVSVNSIGVGIGTLSRGDLDLTSGATLSVAGGLTIGAGGAATMTIDNATLDATGLELGTGGFVNYVSGTLRTTNALHVHDGGQLVLAPGGNKVLRTYSLSVDDQSRLDLADNLLVATYAENNTASTIRDMIRSAYLNGWTGGGITTSLAAANPAIALAIFDNGAAGLTSFRGQPITSHDVIVTPALAGDANLDGKVDISDIAALATNWQRSATWFGGDFTYDGVVDISDLARLATNWQSGAALLQSVLAANGLPTSMLPEPGFMLAWSGVSLALANERRRRGASTPIRRRQ